MPRRKKLPDILVISRKIASKVANRGQLSVSEVTELSNLLLIEAEKQSTAPLLCDIRTIFHAMSKDSALSYLSQIQNLNLEWIFEIFLYASKKRYSSSREEEALVFNMGNIFFSLAKFLERETFNLLETLNSQKVEFYLAFNQLAGKLLEGLKKTDVVRQKIHGADGFFRLFIALNILEFHTSVDKKIILGFLQFVESKNLTKEVRFYSNAYNLYYSEVKSEDPVNASPHNPANPEIEVLKNELKDAQNDRGVAREETAKLQAEITELRETLEATISSQEKEIKRLEAEKRAFEETIFRQRGEAERLRREVEVLRENSQATILQQQREIMRLQDLEAQLRHVSTCMYQLTVQNTQSEWDLRAANQRNNQLAGDLQAAQERHLQVLEAALLVAPSRMQNRHSQAALPAPSGGSRGQGLWWERNPPEYQGRGQRHHR